MQNKLLTIGTLLLLAGSNLRAAIYSQVYTTNPVAVVDAHVTTLAQNAMTNGNFPLIVTNMTVNGNATNYGSIYLFTNTVALNPAFIFPKTFGLPFGMILSSAGISLGGYLLQDAAQNMSQSLFSSTDMGGMSMDVTYGYFWNSGSIQPSDLYLYGSGSLFSGKSTNAAFPNSLLTEIYDSLGQRARYMMYDATGSFNAQGTRTPQDVYLYTKETNSVLNAGPWFTPTNSFEIGWATNGIFYEGPMIGGGTPVYDPVNLVVQRWTGVPDPNLSLAWTPTNAVLGALSVSNSITLNTNTIIGSGFPNSNPANNTFTNANNGNTNGQFISTATTPPPFLTNDPTWGFGAFSTKSGWLATNNTQSYFLTGAQPAVQWMNHGTNITGFFSFQQVTNPFTSLFSNAAPYLTLSNPTNSFVTNVVYTNVASRAILTGSAVLTSASGGSANITLYYTNNGVGYVLPMEAGAGAVLSAADDFPFTVPLSPSATFEFVATFGSGASGNLTNVVLWQQ